MRTERTVYEYDLVVLSLFWNGELRSGGKEGKETGESQDRLRNQTQKEDLFTTGHIYSLCIE